MIFLQNYTKICRRITKGLFSVVAIYFLPKRQKRFLRVGDKQPNSNFFNIRFMFEAIDFYFSFN
jgi:hypothetical protein